MIFKNSLCRAFAVKVVRKRLPVSPFSRLDLYHRFRNDAFFDLYNLLKGCKGQTANALVRLVERYRNTFCDLFQIFILHLRMFTSGWGRSVSCSSPSSNITRYFPDRGWYRVSTPPYQTPSSKTCEPTHALIYAYQSILGDIQLWIGSSKSHLLLARPHPASINREKTRFSTPQLWSSRWL